MAQVVYKDIYYIIYGSGGLQGYILYNMAQVVYKDFYCSVGFKMISIAQVV